MSCFTNVGRAGLHKARAWIAGAQAAILTTVFHTIHLHLMRVAFLVLCVIAQSAHASFPATNGPDEAGIASYGAYSIPNCNVWNGGQANPCFQGNRQEGPVTSAKGYVASANQTLIEIWMGGNFSNSVWSVAQIPYTATCPSNSNGSGGACTCEAGYYQSGSSCKSNVLDLSESSAAADARGQSCTVAGARVGKPIIPATGEKVLTETDYVGDGPDALSLVRTYKSYWSAAGGRVLPPIES